MHKISWAKDGVAGSCSPHALKKELQYCPQNAQIWKQSLEGGWLRISCLSQLICIPQRIGCSLLDGLSFIPGYLSDCSTWEQMIRNLLPRGQHWQKGRHLVLAKWIRADTLRSNRITSAWSVVKLHHDGVQGRSDRVQGKKRTPRNASFHLLFVYPEGEWQVHVCDFLYSFLIGQLSNCNFRKNT